MGSQIRVHKDTLMVEIKLLDTEVNSSGLFHDELDRRYTAEDEMIFFLMCEKMYGRQRGIQRWILKGDTNNEFFHVRYLFQGSGIADPY